MVTLETKLMSRYFSCPPDKKEKCIGSDLNRVVNKKAADISNGTTGAKSFIHIIFTLCSALDFLWSLRESTVEFD